jgi:hypothetical protein
MCCLVLLCIPDHADDRIQQEKHKLARALTDDEAAWAEYVQQYGSGSVMNLIAGPSSKDLPEPARLNAFRNNFKANLRVVDRLNKEAEARGNFAVVYGINVNTHLSPEDYAALRTTGVRADVSVRRCNRRAGPQTAATAGRRADEVVASARPNPGYCNSYVGQVDFPYGSTNPAQSVDWAAQGFVTAVKSQGGCGSCAAFATTVATEWALMQRSLRRMVNNQPRGYYNNLTADLSEDDIMECECEWACRFCAGTSIS